MQKHIVLDTRIIETSTGRYMQRLLENINDFHIVEDVRYTALLPSEHLVKWQKRLPNITVVAADQKWYSFAEQLSLWRQLRSLKPDLVHFTMPQQPLLWTGPAITTIHDTTLLHYDNIDKDDNPLIYKVKKVIFRHLVGVVARRAKAIITPTQFVKDDLLDLLKAKNPDKFHAIHEAGDIPDAKPIPIAELEDKKFLFFVGNAFPYKNVARIIDAFAAIAADYPDLHLALAGKRDGFYEALEDMTNSRGIKNVHFLGFISDSEKVWALQNTQAFVTASLSEGFCIPLLEAMGEGAPVIASNASCLPEVVGDAGELFDPTSTEALAAAIRKVLDDPAYADALRKLGNQRIKSFSWKKMTDETVAVYRSALGL